MSNIINTQNSDIKNTAYKGGNESRYSAAPQKLYKYSFNNSIKERDEFIKNIEQNRTEEKRTEQSKNSFNNLLGICAAVGLFVILELKKII